jgi:hypothetical protein
VTFGIRLWVRLAADDRSLLSQKNAYSSESMSFVLNCDSNYKQTAR